MRRFPLLLLFAFLFAVRVPAQSFTTTPCGSDEGNNNNSWPFGHQDHVCELRRATLPVVDGAVECVGKERRD